MPEQDPDTLRDLLGPLDHQVDDVVEVATVKEEIRGVEVSASKE
jgi:hypothetical protein